MIVTTNNAVAAAIRNQIQLTGSERLFAIVDGCQAYELVQLAKEKYAQPLRMLFKGAAAACVEIEFVAPYLLHVDLDSDFLEQLTSYWGKSIGLLFICASEPREIYRHLRGLFIVQDEAAQEHFFRFYDPRVLRVFLPASTTEELAEFFGTIKCFVLESEDYVALQTFGLDEGKLTSSLQLITSASSS